MEILVGKTNGNTNFNTANGSDSLQNVWTAGKDDIFCLAFGRDSSPTNKPPSCPYSTGHQLVLYSVVKDK
jgi:hypothetical protein